MAPQGKFLQKTVLLPLVAEVSTSDLAAALGAAAPSFFFAFLTGYSKRRVSGEQMCSQSISAIKQVNLPHHVINNRCYYYGFH